MAKKQLKNKEAAEQKERKKESMNPDSKAAGSEETVSDNVLPQNIFLVGENEREKKIIYIAQKVYQEIHRFTKDKIKNESGGILVGTVVEEFGKSNIIINGFIEAKYCEATPTTLKFTHETWQHIHKELDKKFAGQKIMGWIHTHPDFGIFLSEYDKFIQETFFNEENQVAYVIDPVQRTEGFYFWTDGNIERCGGFYIFDKNGVKIDAIEEKKARKEPAEREEPEKATGQITALVIMAVIMVILIFVMFLQNSRLTRLQEQQEALANFVNRSLINIQLQMNQLHPVEESDSTAPDIQD